MENLELSELKFPSMREELVSYLTGLSDSDYQFHAWVERSSPNLAYDELDYTIHFLYDDTGLAENAYTWIGLVLKMIRKLEPSRTWFKLLTRFLISMVLIFLIKSIWKKKSGHA